ncbi:MAG: hypothetical protein FWH20_10065 [Oscillospiraceae bacterium]|nr:hypothetical protein [Oscillospiraceae bacterium]
MKSTAGMEKLLKTAGARLGMSPERLMGALEKGDVNDILANMNTRDKQKLKSVLEGGNPMETLMKSPQAAEMMRQMQANS